MKERPLRRFVHAASWGFAIAVVAVMAGQTPVAAPSISFDMVAVDREGRAPDNLGPADVTVSVDGKPRRVLTVRRVSRGPGASSDAAARQARGGGAGAFAAEPSRIVLVIVDQAGLVRGDERAAVTAAHAFLDRLGMADRLAVLRLPLASSQQVSLTTEQPVVRQALASVTGQIMASVPARPGEFSADRDRDRALAVDPDRERTADPVVVSFVPEVPPVEMEIDQAAARGNLVGLAGVLQALQPVPGRKVVALFSAGAASSPAAQWTDLAVAALAGRTTIYAFGLAGPRDAAHPDLNLRPLETLAKATGGALMTLGGNLQRVIGGVVADLAACYVVELEGSGSDADGRRHILRVEMANRSLRVRAPAWLVPAPDAGDIVPAGPGPGVGASSAGVSPMPAAEEARSGRVSAGTSARGDELQVAMGRLVDYVEAYERQYSGLVAEEEYRQWAPRGGVRLRSDYLLVKLERSDVWVSFRDVYEVDGVAVRDRDDRLRRLFLEPGVQLQAQLTAIQAESTRYNIGAVERNVNVPLFPLRFLTPANRLRLRFRCAGRRQSAGIDVWRIEFEEVGRPTIMVDIEGRDVPAKGWFLVDQTTGAIVESAVRVAEHGSTGEISVSFRRDPALGMWVPAKMTETYRALGQGPMGGALRLQPFLEGTATYARYRRFQVKTEEKITIPK